MSSEDQNMIENFYCPAATAGEAFVFIDFQNSPKRRVLQKVEDFNRSTTSRKFKSDTDCDEFLFRMFGNDQNLNISHCCGFGRGKKILTVGDRCFFVNDAVGVYSIGGDEEAKMVECESSYVATTELDSGEKQKAVIKLASSGEIPRQNGLDKPAATKIVDLRNTNYEKYEEKNKPSEKVNFPVKVDKRKVDDICEEKALKTSKRVTAQTNTYKFECHECGEAFFTQSELLLHKKIDHIHASMSGGALVDLGRDKLMDPNVKGTGTINSGGRDSVGASINSADSEHVIHECEQCQTRFADALSLNVHLKQHFVEVTNFYNCSTCAKVFHTKSALESHMASHQDPGFECNVCGGRFSHKKNWKAHAETHLKNRIRHHKCFICGREFFRNSDLKRHKSTVHPPEDAEMFTCDVCGKPFTLKVNLKIHYKKHLTKQIGRAKCYFCEAVFHSTPSLKEHMKTHGFS